MNKYIEDIDVNKLIDENLSSKEREKEFANVYKAFFRPLMSFVTRLNIAYDQAEDIVSLSLTKAFHKLHTYKPDRKFSTWVYAITKNAALDYLRKKHIETVSINRTIYEGDTGDVSIEDTIASTNPTSLDIMQANDRALICREIVSNIDNEKVRKCIELRYFRELTYDEIVNITNLPLGTVKANMYRGRQEMLEYCKKHNIRNII